MKCSIQDIISKLKAHKKAFWTGQLIAILSAVIISVIPLFIPLLVDEILLQKQAHLTLFISQYFWSMTPSGYIIFVLVMIVVLRIVSAMLSILQTKIFATIAKDITYHIRVELLGHLKKVSLREYENFRIGEITSKLVTDVSTVDDFIGSAIGKLIVAVLTLVFSTVVLLWINWQLALFILITNPVVMIFTSKMSRNIGKLKKEANRAVADFQSNSSETLELFHQIKATSKEDYFFDNIINSAKNLKIKAVDYAYKSDVATKYSSLIFLNGYELFRAAGLIAVLYSDLSIGLMLAVFSYLWIMSVPIQNIIDFQYSLSGAKASCDRINEIFSLTKEREVSEETDPFANKESVRIELRNVSFAYKNSDNILKNISLNIKSKSKVAIVGASGSGKTTLANLIVGFYEPTNGEILYDGTLAKNIKLATIRKNIHLILQQPKLFNDTIRFNLTLGDYFTNDEIGVAVKLAELEEVVNSLENGMDSKLGRDGIRLSGGQRQRIAIARAVLHSPKVVIFDESTSALDMHTESKIFLNIKYFLNKRTVITIAHRPSTIKEADMIFVIQNGELVDSGTPNELIEKENSYFANMS